jgi:formylglycine-generating enzyme required for sulfatase activity
MKKDLICRPALLCVLAAFCYLSFVVCEKNPATLTTGTVQGHVTNAAGDTLIAGVNVWTTPPTDAVSTDGQGRYTIAGVSPGEYTVVASKGGYKSGGVNITIAAGQTTTANIYLAKNNPPSIPTLISPANGSTGQPTIITLSWTCSDPYGDSLVYDVYFGKTTPPATLIAPAQNGTSIFRSGLDTLSTYYWRTVAKNNKERTLTIGDIWSFTTQRDKSPIAPETLAVPPGLVRPIVMKDIPAGRFVMGDSALNAGWAATPLHYVTLSAFKMQETQVTQEQYQAVMGTNPSWFNSGADAPLRPVEMVNWNDAVQFCNALSKLCGFDTVYNTTSWTADFTKKGFRLPTEAEYEYACRGGTTTNYWWGTDTNGMGVRTWSVFNSNDSTHPVATKLPNAYGLYDMTGNVDEWCNDWYGNYTSDAVIDPSGPVAGTSRVLRGGSWRTISGYRDVDIYRSAFRIGTSQGSRFMVFGFRVVLSR